jgi:Yip1-like protein
MDQPHNHTDPQAAAYGVSPPPPPPPPSAEEPAQIGPLGRLTGTLISPGETFKDVNRKPTWVVPVIIGMITVLGSTLFFNWRVHPDWDTIMRTQIKKGMERSGRELSEEQIQQQVTIAKKIQSFSPIIAVVFTPVFYVVLAGIFALGLLLIQAQTTFKKILSVVCWSNAAVGLIGVLVVIASLLIRDEESLRSIDPSQPAGIVPTNLGAFLPSDVSAPLKSIAASVDIFTIWLLILLTIGFAAIAGGRKITTSKTGRVVFGLWIIWVLVKAGFSAVFRGFGG